MSLLTIDERTRYQQYALSSPIAAEQRENECARAAAFPRLLAAYIYLDTELAEASGVHEEQAREIAQALDRCERLQKECYRLTDELLACQRRKKSPASPTIEKTPQPSNS